nr:hypothetical protein [Enterococcus hirae]
MSVVLPMPPFLPVSITTFPSLSDVLNAVRKFSIVPSNFLY